MEQQQLLQPLHRENYFHQNKSLPEFHPTIMFGNSKNKANNSGKRDERVNSEDRSLHLYVPLRSFHCRIKSICTKNFESLIFSLVNIYCSYPIYTS